MPSTLCLAGAAPCDVDPVDALPPAGVALAPAVPAAPRPDPVCARTGGVRVRSRPEPRR